MKELTKMLIGYARVSTTEQDTALQLDAFERAGVRVVFEEKLSAVSRRPLLEAMLYCLRRGDTVVVYKLDRLARSLADLLRVLERIKACGATVRSVTEPVDTDTPIGVLMVQQLGAFAQFERSMIRERCAAGTRAAMARGVRWGRPRKFDWELAEQLTGEGATPYELGQRFGVHHTAVRLALKTLRTERLKQRRSSKEDFSRSLVEGSRSDAK